MSQIRYAKPPLRLAGQVTLLRSRGMVIPDATYAEQVLLRLNYYRFCGYALHFEVFENRKRTDRFVTGTIFDQVVELYQFDEQLRTLLFRYIEPIEIAFRSALCYELAIRTGNSHWYLDRGVYTSRFDYQRLVDDCQRECERSDETFVASYKAKYNDPPLLPAWMMTEILSMGQWSRIFQYLADVNAKKAVAQHFAVKPYYLQSWLHVLTVCRNLCAHHARLWNRTFTIAPRLPEELRSVVKPNTTLAALVVIIVQLLKPLHREAGFAAEFAALLASFPNVPQDRMGDPLQALKVVRR